MKKRTREEKIAVVVSITEARLGRLLTPDELAELRSICERRFGLEPDEIAA